MPESILTRIKNAWNVFRYGENNTLYDVGIGYGYDPSRVRLYYNTERSLITSIYNRIGIDVSSIGIQHVKLDENGRFSGVINSSLNNCLTLEANIDQTGRSFIQDVVMSLCDEGSVAIVPTDTSFNPYLTNSYDILSLRTGRIVQWFPEHVLVDLYNQQVGRRQDIMLPKTQVAIIENPLFSVMNEPNSTLKRLIEKLNILDVIDAQSGSGKLDLIIQLPYVIKSQTKQDQADARKAAIESQLADSKYGIAYVDATEKITQLNRPAENNLMGQIEFLTTMLWNQLGLTKEVFEGTADEATMINYYNRTIEPFLGAITDGMKRTFLTKTARSQGQSIMAIRDPFRLVPASSLAELADKFTRNEIVSPNEVRSVLGMLPSKDPKAEELRNRNISSPTEDPVVEKKIKMEGKLNDNEETKSASA